MARATVAFDSLLEAFDFVSFGAPMENEAYLCTETGEIFWHSEFADADMDEPPLPDDIDDSDKYIAIPHKADLGLGKPLVLKFAGELLPDDFGKVQEIFSRSGAYARFKDLLEHRGMLERWYEYEKKAGEDALREWCEDNDIEVDG